MQLLSHHTYDGSLCRHAALTTAQTCCPCRLLTLWLGDPALTAGREVECLALAIATAELAEVASCSAGLPGGPAPLLTFVDGCRRVAHLHDLTLGHCSDIILSTTLQNHCQ